MSARAPALLCLLLACGCLEEPRVRQSAYPSAGLYTPGNRLGASDPSDTPNPAAGLGDRCVSLPGGADAGAATAGTLTLEYTTRSLEGRYAPKNCTAAWIETLDGAYVATIEIGAALRRPGLVYWQDHACVEKTGPDVVTSATLADHERPHTAFWKGFDLDELAVPDGTYVLQIEVTESDKEPGEISTFEIDKGPESYSMSLPVDVDGPLVDVSVSWMPEDAGGN